MGGKQALESNCRVRSTSQLGGCGVDGQGLTKVRKH
jgi:hypothetical protein